MRIHAPKSEFHVPNKFFVLMRRKKNIMVCQSLLKWRTVRFTFMLEYQAKIFPLSRGLMSSRTDIKVQHEQTKNEWNPFKVEQFILQTEYVLIYLNFTEQLHRYRVSAGFQIFLRYLVCLWKFEIFLLTSGAFWPFSI